MDMPTCPETANGVVEIWNECPFSFPDVGLAATLDVSETGLPSDIVCSLGSAINGEDGAVWWTKRHGFCFRSPKLNLWITGPEAWNIPYIVSDDPWPVSSLTPDTIQILYDIYLGQYDHYRRSEKLSPARAIDTKGATDESTRPVSTKVDEVDNVEDGDNSSSPRGKDRVNAKPTNMKYFVEIFSGPNGPLASAVSESG